MAGGLFFLPFEFLKLSDDVTRTLTLGITGLAMFVTVPKKCFSIHLAKKAQQDRCVVI